MRQIEPRIVRPPALRRCCRDADADDALFFQVHGQLFSRGCQGSEEINRLGEAGACNLQMWIRA